jgi:PleD family two-component response regulator
MMQVETKYPAVVNIDALRLDANCLYGSSCLVVMRRSKQRHNLVHYLEKAGALVLIADAAAEAAVILSNIRPDLVISASGLSFKEGSLFISFLRSLPAKKGGDLPAIAVGKETSVEGARSALAIGFDQYFVETAPGLDLIRQVANLMDKLP